MLSFFSLLMNISILWSNDTVKIPVGDSLEAYKSIPEAKLYMENKLVEDPLMYYEYEINFTSFSVIRTHVVGTYTVWYRAHFPTLGFESDTAVTFLVYDHISPVIKGQKDIYVDVGTKSIDYPSLVTYSDNYDHQKDLVLSVNAAQVNLNQTGRYQVTYLVKDTGDNQTTWIQHIHVVDQVKPVVKQKMQVEIVVGERIDLDKFFTFSDNYDTTLDIWLDDQGINYQRPNTYPAILIVKDQSGNETKLNFNVKVLDLSAPRIVLKVNQIEVNYQSSLTDTMLRSYIASVEDNIDTLSSDQVVITSYLDTNYLGSYEVIYKITDSSNLTGETKLIVEVVDKEPPTVIMVEPIIALVGDLEPYVYDYLSITDNYDRLEDLTITKTGTITMSKVGSYRIIIKVIDKSKNTTEFPVVVEVVDLTAPILDVVPHHVITNFLKPDYETLITTSDNYDKALEITIDDHHVNYDQIGVYDVWITVTDSSQNATSKFITIEIKDLSYPEIILKTHQVYIPYGTVELDYLMYIESVYDSYDKDLKLKDVLVDSTIDLERVGLYQINYSLEDKSGNIGTALVYVFIHDYEKPVIEAQPMTIKVGMPFNYLSHVYAYDNYDGDISHLVQMNPVFIPLHEPGYYEVVFYVHDSSGNYTETKVLLTVLEADDVGEYIYYLGGGVCLVGLVVIYYLYRKKREKM